LESKRVGAQPLQDWTAALFRALGVSSDSALAAADSLVDADLRGIGTHGVVRIPIYVERLQRGAINKEPQARFTAAELLEGDNGLGQWVGALAIDRACELAERAGIGIVIATRSAAVRWWFTTWLPAGVAGNSCSAIPRARSPSSVATFLDRRALERLFIEQPISHVIHLAAWLTPDCQRDPYRGCEINVLGTVRLFELLRANRERIEGFAFASFVAAHGREVDDAPGSGTGEGMAGEPETFYGAFKRAIESIAKQYWLHYGIPSVALARGRRFVFKAAAPRRGRKRVCR